MAAPELRLSRPLGPAGPRAFSLRLPLPPSTAQYEWDRFMRFMERYAESNGLGFSKA
jgi:hypothetical protein